MTPDELRSRAREEANELGDEPTDPRERELWIEERREGRDPPRRPRQLESVAVSPRRAELWEPFVQRLLLDAAEERG